MVSKPALIPRLVIIEGKDKGKVITLTDGTVVVGRSKADVLVQDPRISRSHVAIHFNSVTNKLSFTDLKSLNGTELNGTTAESGDLKDGDRLQIGNTVFDIQISIASEELTSTSEILARSRQRTAAKLSGEKNPNAPLPKEAPQAPPKNEPSPSLLPLEAAEEMLSKEPALNNQSSTKTELKTKLRPPSVEKIKNFYTKLPRIAQRSLWAVLLIISVMLLWPDTNQNNRLDSTLSQEVIEIQKIEKTGLLDEAIARALKLTEKHPDRSEGYLLLGSLYATQNKAQEALNALSKAHILPPEQPVSHIKMVRLYLRSGMAKEAAEELRHVELVMQEKKFSRELFIEQAQLYLEFKDLKYSPERVLILSKGLQKEFAPESSIGYKLEAQVHFQANRPQEALSAMEKGRMVDPQDEWLIENTMFAKLSLKDFAGAETILDEWLKLKPTATKALLVFGYLKFNEKNYAKAIPYVQKILQLGNASPGDPYFPEALNLMGQIYQQLQQPNEALNFFRQGCSAGFQQSCEQPLLKAEAGSSSDQTATANLSPNQGLNPTTTPSNVPAPASIAPPSSSPLEAPQNSADQTPVPSRASPPSLKAPSALDQIAPPPSESD